MTRIAGFTLTEIMITLVIGSILLAALMQLFLNMKQVNQYQQGMARLQENMQTASILFGQWIRGAGDYGCNRFDETVQISVSSDIDSRHYGLIRQQPIQVVSPDVLQTLPQISAHAHKRYKFGTDMIFISHVPAFFNLQDYTQGHQGDFIVNGAPNFKQGDVLIVTDCQNMDVVKAAKEPSTFRKDSSVVTYQRRDASAQLSKLYAPQAKVGKLESEILYVADTYRKNQAGDPVWALYATDINGQTLELIEGVEDLRIAFSTNEDVDQFVSAWHWDKNKPIHAVQIALLLTSIENTHSEPKSYKLNEQTITPNDRQMRQWWSQAWTIRSAA